MENKKSIFSLFRSAVKSDFVISNDVERAKRNGRQLVALESALITHGVPWPENLNIARALEQTVRDNGAYPATIAVQEGQLRVGLTSSQLETLAGARDARKCSLWDLSGALTHGGSAGTTVASTLYAAERAEIKVFATGGIGGVHRGGGGQQGELYGWSVAGAGDVNGDGCDELLVGAPLYDRDQADEGSAYLYYGSPLALLTQAAWSSLGGQKGAHLGAAVDTAGDLNGDGFSDVVVGVSNQDNTTVGDRVPVCYCGPAGLPGTAS